MTTYIPRLLSSEPDATDVFCGAGGTGQAAAKNGVPVRTAINHWKTAGASYQANFPNTIVHIQDVEKARPADYPSTWFGLFSPSCAHQGTADGKKKPTAQLPLPDLDDEPTEAEMMAEEAYERSRCTALDVIRFVEYHRYPWVIVENVPRFCAWRFYEYWVSRIKRLGYQYRAVFFNSRFIRSTQSRGRYYGTFVRSDLPLPNLDFMPKAWCEPCGKDVYSIQSWKRGALPYGDYGVRNGQYVYCCEYCARRVEPYYAPAINDLELSDKGSRIGDKNLVPKTLARVRAGLAMLANEPPFDPSRRNPFILNMRADNAPTSAFASFPTVTTGDHQYPVFPAADHFISGDYSGGTHYYAPTGSVPTITPTHSHTLIGAAEGFVSSYHGEGGHYHHLTDSAPTVTTRDGHAVITSDNGFLSTYHDRADTSHSLLDPAPTVDGSNRTAVVSTTFMSSSYSRSDANSSTLDSMPTITTGVLPRHAVVRGERVAGTKVKPEDISDDVLMNSKHRLITIPEVKRIMGFNPDHVVLGNKREQMAQYGGAVVPEAEAWIIKRCLDTIR